ncbi:N-acetylmuramoyl-L-alanine amidase [Chitinasiproducens palmae]|nr:N-acetylmuramoyl-L-alanine amidase [Chitinasiproducens palmae]
MFKIDYNSYRALSAYNRRVRFLVFHYTALDFAGSVRALSGKSVVSAHYLIPDPTDASYAAAGYDEVRIFNLVDEGERAWHAGVSSWAGRTNLNDSSIGIEIVNRASDTGGQWHFPPFEPRQMAAVKQIALNILQRYPDIDATHVIGHSDIAPGRKSDPGPAFPWHDLHQAGIGAWYDENDKQRFAQAFERNGIPSTAELIAGLGRYGYDTAAATSTSGLAHLVRAFQLHFRPAKLDGVVDVETAAVLYALLARYRAS